MDRSPTTRELLEVEVFFGEDGDVVPAVFFDDVNWQSPNYEQEWLEGEMEPELVASDGAPYRVKEFFAVNGSSYGWHRVKEIETEPQAWGTLTEEMQLREPAYARLKQGWAGIRIVGFPSHSLGARSGDPYDSEFQAEMDQLGARELFDDSFGCLSGAEEQIVLVAKRLAREAEDERVRRESQRRMRGNTVERRSTHHVSMILVCEVYRELHTDWETGIVDDAPLIVKILGPLDFANLPAMPCPEFADDQAQEGKVTQ